MRQNRPSDLDGAEDVGVELICEGFGPETWCDVSVMKIWRKGMYLGGCLRKIFPCSDGDEGGVVDQHVDSAVNLGRLCNFAVQIALVVGDVEL